MGFIGDQEGEEEELAPARVMDIIDETGPDIVHRLNQDFRFRMQVGKMKEILQLTSLLFTDICLDYSINVVQCWMLNLLNGFGLRSPMKTKYAGRTVWVHLCLSLLPYAQTL